MFFTLTEKYYAKYYDNVIVTLNLFFSILINSLTIYIIYFFLIILKDLFH